MIFRALLTLQLLGAGQCRRDCSEAIADGSGHQGRWRWLGQLIDHQGLKTLLPRLQSGGREHVEGQNSWNPILLRLVAGLLLEHHCLFLVSKIAGMSRVKVTTNGATSFPIKMGKKSVLVRKPS